MAVTLQTAVEKLRLTAPFHISGYVFEEQEAVVVTLHDGRHRGRGEASGVYYLGDTAEIIVKEIERARAAVEQGVDRAGLLSVLPPGGARNALDCALWDLDAQRTGKPAWRLAGLPAPRPLRTTFTVGAGEPGAMALEARKYAQARAIKAKLTGHLELDIARVSAIREARPEVWLGVDANQGYTIDALHPLVVALLANEVSLLEQPLKRGCEAELDGFRSPVPMAADESALSLRDVPALAGRFQVVNIKLDKCGGLTEGLAMAHEARRLGLKVMVGNMVGSSLAMAPAFVLGQLCDVVDLDGPIFLARDRTPGVVYSDGNVWSGPEVWGGGAPVPA